MNLILFESQEIDFPLPRADRRAGHILDVLRRRVGETFDAGLINGPRGKATLAAIHADALLLTFAWDVHARSPEPVTLVVGLPRPQTARDILREATALGVAGLHFVATDKGEPSYAQSTLWSSGEWRRHALEGAAQAFDTRLPEVSQGCTLSEAIALLPPSGARIALDNYESTDALGQIHLANENPMTLAIGAERGWSARERDMLRKEGFILAHLGTRVLRVETAAIAALAIVRAKLRLM